MLPSDVTVESGNDQFFYMARNNSIFKCYVDEEARQAALKRLSQEAQAPDGAARRELSGVHANLERIATIESRYAKYQAQIEAFRVVHDNKTTYVYASSRSHIFFNQLSQFGKLFSGSKLLPPALARGSSDIYIDDSYGQVSAFNGPFEILVMPFLSSNRISLRGVHHEPEPIFY